VTVTSEPGRRGTWQVVSRKTLEEDIKKKGVSTVLLFSAVGLFILLGVLAVITNWKEVRQVIGEANWHLAPLAFVLSAISYFLIGYSFLVISRIFGITLRARDLIAIGYVTNVLDSLLPALGVPGLSVRVLILERRGLPAGEAWAPSLFRSYFNNVVFIAFLPVALVYVLLSHHLTGPQITGIVLAAGLIILFLLGATAGVFSHSVRRRLLHVASWTWRVFTRRNIESPLIDFEVTFGHGVNLIRSNPRVLIPLIGVIAGAWLAATGVVWSCFIALNTNLGFGLVLAGLFIGRTAGVISFLPGGLGAQDASMVGVYVLSGVPLAQAVLVAILFRLVYYFIPFAISIGFYRSLLRQPKI